MSLLINMKMPTITSIFIFINRENSMLSGGAKKSFITSGPIFQEVVCVVT